MVIQRGGTGSVLLGLFFFLLLIPFLIKFVVDSDVLPVYPMAIFLPLAVPFLNILFWYLLPVVFANFAMIFFHMTGRFPSWLEDLSP
jgi:peptidoglycan biosynthesis protein MviN/MurJ (putative lipid II flippase)